ncbi:MAG: T9SS type A sorting domain-containing protein [Bacteroidales bacterium]|nr:T9SS type A sorting domain-containing protein [Bacteroidales bacterium]
MRLFFIFLSGPDGRLVNTQTLEPGNAVSEIALQALPPGTYFLRIKNGHKLNVYKIIKL